MAIIRNGIFGPVSGKLGGTVVYELNNRTVVRVVGKNTTPPSFRQLVNRNEMRVVNAFLKHLLTFIKIGFAQEAKARNMYPHNVAVSYIKKHALTGVYPNVEVDFEKVVLSSGNLPGLGEPNVLLTAEGLKFSWDPQSWMGWVRCNDQAILLAYFPDVDPNKGVRNSYYTLDGAKRIMGGDFLPIPAELLQERMEVYISVLSHDRKILGTSMYLGRIN